MVSRAASPMIVAQPPTLTAALLITASVWIVTPRLFGPGNPFPSLTWRTVGAVHLRLLDGSRMRFIFCACISLVGITVPHEDGSWSRSEYQNKTNLGAFGLRCSM